MCAYVFVSASMHASVSAFHLHGDGHVLWHVEKHTLSNICLTRKTSRLFVGETQLMIIFRRSLFVCVQDGP